MKTQTETISTIRYAVFNRDSKEYVAAILGTDLVQTCLSMEASLKLNDIAQAELIKQISINYFNARAIMKKPDLVIHKITTSVEVTE